LLIEKGAQLDALLLNFFLLHLENMSKNLLKLCIENVVPNFTLEHQQNIPQKDMLELFNNAFVKQENVSIDVLEFLIKKGAKVNSSTLQYVSDYQKNNPDKEKIINLIKNNLSK
jgi:hypothetical protein